MTVEHIVMEFNNTRSFTDDIIESIQNNDIIRIALCDYFKSHSDRGFAIALMDWFIALRLNPAVGTAGEDLMLAAYILGKHKHVEDCLKIWEAKKTDFDAFCYIDVQLMVFAGVQQTVDFLNNQANNKAVAEALEYVVSCKEAGDFDDIDSYYAKGNIPWFI